MKKILISGVALLLGACSMLQSEQEQVQHKQIHQFMYCASVHEQLGDVALKEYKIDHQTSTQDAMLDWYDISGSEAQYATEVYYKTYLASPMDMAEYNRISNELKGSKTIKDIATDLGVPDAVQEAERDVSKVLAKIGSNGILQQDNYDTLDKAFEGKCFEQFSDYTDMKSELLSQKEEASVAVQTSGVCIGTYNALSMMATDTSPAAVKPLAQMAGVMSSITYGYLNEENVEALYDHIYMANERLVTKRITQDELYTQLQNCQETYKVANQYMVQHIVDAKK